MTRRADFISICESSGARVIAPADGWPGRASVDLANGQARNLLIYAAPTTTHARGIEGEVRLQPPGQNRPVQKARGSLTLIIGTSGAGTLIGIDATRHIGRNERWTVTFREELIRQATSEGWATAERPLSQEGSEHIHAFHPALLPTYVEMVENHVNIEPLAVSTAVIGAGLNVAGSNLAARERARQATSRLVRDAKFSKDVRDAYGDACAMCGLRLGLVTGAHVLPVAAPSSPDEVWNGICLCENHHRAFDKHLIYIDPKTRRIRLHPLVIKEAAITSAGSAFAQSTFAKLQPTKDPTHNVAPEMLTQRYKYFKGLYEWAG